MPADDIARWRANLVFQPKHVPNDAMQIRIANRDRDHLEGYHIIGGVPHAVVYTRSSGGVLADDWPATFSHEVLEMIADPGVNLYADGFVRDGGRRRHAFIPYEVCDPVQDNSYKIEGIAVSDFVVPEWFEPDRRAGSMKFSYKNSVDRPFALAPGGYIDAIVKGHLKTIWGPDANKKKIRHRHEIRKNQLVATHA